MKLQDRASFYQILHRGIISGLSIQQVLDAGLLPPTLESEAGKLQQELAKGSSVARALSVSGLVSPWEAELINVGEVSGKLEDVLSRLEDCFTQKTMRLRQLRSKLIYPFLTVLFAIVVLPLPELANETLSLSTFFTQGVAKLFLLYLVYHQILIRPMTSAAPGFINPRLVKSLKYVNRQHFLRQQFEISYLDLMTLCLNSGMDAVNTLKLIQRCCNNRDFYNRHTIAIHKIENNGTALSEVLRTEGLLQNPGNLSFLAASEVSGTLHSDMQEYIQRKKHEIAARVDFWIKRISSFIYAMVVIYTSLNIIGAL